jgi:hypothetical protein
MRANVLSAICCCESIPASVGMVSHTVGETDLRNACFDVFHQVLLHVSIFRYLVCSSCIPRACDTYSCYPQLPSIAQLALETSREHWTNRKKKKTDAHQAR